MSLKKINSIVFLLICLGISSSFYSQQNKIDSLNIVLKSNALALEKAKALVALSDEVYITNIDTVLLLSEEALQLLETIGPGDKVQQQNTLIVKAFAINNIGYVYKHYGNQSKALSYFLKALKIREQINDEKGIVESYNNLASVYNAHGDSEGALKYYEKGLSIARKIKDVKGEANILNNIAIIYKSDSSTYDLALNYYTKSLELENALNNTYQIGNRLHNIADLYQNKGDYAKAKDFYLKSIEKKESIEDEKGLMNSFNSLANLELEMGNLAEAEKLAKKSLGFAQEQELTYGIIQASQTLYEIYSEQKRWQDALKMHEIYSENRDLQIEEANSDETTEMQMQFEFDKKMAADSLKASEEQKVIAERFKSEKVQRYALYGGLTLVAIFALFIFNRFRVTQKQKHIIEIKEQETQKQKHIIEEKHKEITDSINYAERIQRSFLATKEILDENLKEYFVLFKPKDVVSGDFYWAAPLSLPSGGGKVETKFALVTADSTGHGVPGAIMSLLNITSIEGAIKDRFIEPSDILNATRKTIIERLKKDGSIEGGKDGMDASLCVYDFKNKKLTIAAANNPVWIVRYEEGAVEPSVVEVKPDKMPIGKHDKDSISFTQQEIDLQPGDVIYTLTDGFPDQFGGPNGKKFMSKNLRELLATNAHLPMQQQKELLEKTFADWVGNMEQVDDVCLIGVRV